MFYQIKMKIGFLSNKLTLRGTEVCLYDYADMSEKILGHQSVILTRPLHVVQQLSPRDVHPMAYEKFARRFPICFFTEPHEVRDIVKREGIDILFLEKAGAADDGYFFPDLCTIIHCVFTAKHPHGTLYTVISDFINEDSQTEFPVLPYMVRVADTKENLRKELGIPEDALVFGTYSGADEFNIPYMKDVVERLVTSTKSEDQKFWFLFLNINPFGSSHAQASHRLKFLPGTANMDYKRKFINTCNAMFYGRDGGETFGLSCGEFSVCDKPVIGRPGEHSKFHEQMLCDSMIHHCSAGELLYILHNWDIVCASHMNAVMENGYKKYTPENVMKIFQNHLETLSKTS